METLYEPRHQQLYLLVLVAAFTRGGLSRHHQLRHSRLDGSVLSPSCVAEDSRFQACHDCGCRRSSLITSPSGRSVLWTGCAGILVRRRRHRSSAVDTQSLRLTRRMRRMMSLSKTSNVPSSAASTGHVSQPLSRIDRTTAWWTLFVVRNDISRRDQGHDRD